MNGPMTLWLAGVTVATLGTWVLWDAAAGLNWGVCTLAVTGGGLACGRSISTRPGARVGLCAIACALAGGAAITADPFFQVLIALGVASLLAMATYLAEDPRAERIGLALALVAPFLAIALGLGEAARRVGELAAIVGARRQRPVLRGGLLALAVVCVFAAILAGADPILTVLRDELVDVLERLEFLPRLMFFGMLLVGAVGSYGMASRPAAVTAPPRPAAPASRWTETERLIVLGAVVLLFAAFLALQVSYLFGNAPALAGSGITFAEYARRGFAELSLVTSLCTLLMLWLERGGRRQPRELGLALALTALLGILLVSAFRRLWLYEEAYGFTTARLYAQAYMVVVALALGLLVIELARGLEAGRFLRRTATAGILVVLVLSVWNHESWIAEQNLRGTTRGGPPDVHYLVWNLSVNAVPTIVRALDQTPSSDALARALRERYTRRMTLSPCRWFEWNLRRIQAAKALHDARLITGEAPTPGVVPRCITLTYVSHR